MSAKAFNDSFTAKQKDLNCHNLEAQQSKRSRNYVLVRANCETVLLRGHDVTFISISGRFYVRPSTTRTGNCSSAT